MCSAGSSDCQQSPVRKVARTATKKKSPARIGAGIRKDSNNHAQVHHHAYTVRHLDGLLCNLKMRKGRRIQTPNGERTTRRDSGAIIASIGVLRHVRWRTQRTHLLLAEQTLLLQRSEVTLIGVPSRSNFCAPAKPILGSVSVRLTVEVAIGVCFHWKEIGEISVRCESDGDECGVRNAA